MTKGKMLARVGGTGAWFAFLWLAWMVCQVPYTVMRAYGDNLSEPRYFEGIEKFTFGGVVPTRFLQEQLPFDTVPGLAHGAYLLHGFWFGVPFALGLIIMIYQREKLLPFLGWQIALFHAAAIIFLVLPVRPPWMEDGVFRILSEIDAYDYTVVDNNPAAAFPSLHAGLPALVTIFVFLEFPRRLRFLGWLVGAYTVAVSFAIVYLGEHWVVDVAAGYAVATMTALAFRSRWIARVAFGIPGNPLGRLVELNRRILSPRATLRPAEMPVRAEERDIAA